MDLKNMLMNSMGSKESVEALAKKSGSSTKEASSFLSSALPTLLQHLTQNASTETGVASLANALTQHTDTSSMAQQIANADTADGSAIVSHILGDDSSNTVNSISAETGIGAGQVTNLLSSIAPALLSGVSVAAGSALNNKPAQEQQSTGGFDFSSLLGMFGGSGNVNSNTTGSTGTTLINSLLGFLK